MWLIRKLTTLLKIPQVYNYYSQSIVVGDKYAEINIVKYLQSWNSDLKQDTYGNLYILNPWTPLVCAHMDTVQMWKDTNAITVNWLIIKNWDIKAKPTINTYTKNKQWWGIIGGDDKCGVAMLMQLYEEYWDNISILFTRQEETGCHWIAAFAKEHGEELKELNYCLVLDRRWEWDIIGYNNWYCSKQFEKNLSKHIKSFWYEPADWLSSDANVISRYINTVNLSVWYYNPHMDTEYINIQDFLNAYAAVDYLLQNFGERNVPIYKRQSTTTYRRKKWMIPYVDDDDDINGIGRNDKEDDYMSHMYWGKADYDKDEVTLYMCMDDPNKYNVIYDNTTGEVLPKEWYMFLFTNYKKVNDYRVKKIVTREIKHNKTICPRCSGIWYLTAENDICDKCDWTGEIIQNFEVYSVPHQQPLLPAGNRNNNSNNKTLNSLSANIVIENDNTLIAHADVYLRNKKDNTKKIFLPRGRYFYHK